MSSERGFEEVAERAEARLAAMERGDLLALKGILHDELVYIHSSARVDDKASFLSSIAERVLDYHSFSASDVRFLLVSDRVVQRIGVLSTSVTARGTLMQLDNRFIETWVRNDAWQMISWQSTPRK